MYKNNIAVCKVLAGIVLAAALYTFPAGADVLYSENSALVSVEDRANLLSDSDEHKLLQLAENLADTTGMEFRVLTIDDAEGKSTASYAEDYFESMSELFAGGCYILDMENREYYVATYGDLQYYLTDDRIDRMVDRAGDDARSSDWSGTLSSMMSDTISYIEEGIQDGTVIYNQDTGTYTHYEPPKAVTPFEALMSGSVGLLGFCAMFFTNKRRYQMKDKDPNDYVESDNVHLKLRARNDRLIDKHISRRLIPRDDDHKGGGGGGHTSTVHISSGGHSAGGGGGHF